MSQTLAVQLYPELSYGTFLLPLEWVPNGFYSDHYRHLHQSLHIARCRAPKHTRFSDSCLFMQCNRNPITYDIQPTPFDLCKFFVTPLQCSTIFRLPVRQRMLLASFHEDYRFHRFYCFSLQTSLIYLLDDHIEMLVWAAIRNRKHSEPQSIFHHVVKYKLL